MQRHSTLKLRLLALGAFALFGVTLAGVRPTGFVVGASQEGVGAAGVAGLLVIACSLALVAGELRLKRLREEEAQRLRNERETRVA